MISAALPAVPGSLLKVKIQFPLYLTPSSPSIRPLTWSLPVPSDLWISARRAALSNRAGFTCRSAPGLQVKQRPRQIQRYLSFCGCSFLDNLISTGYGQHISYRFEDSNSWLRWWEWEEREREKKWKQRKIGLVWNQLRWRSGEVGR